MSEAEVRVCVGCGEVEENIRFDNCGICRKSVCSDCAERAFGRRFCSHDCARSYVFSGDFDDDENFEPE
jgi:hypothetical protein